MPSNEKVCYLQMEYPPLKTTKGLNVVSFNPFSRDEKTRTSDARQLCYIPIFYIFCIVWASPFRLRMQRYDLFFIPQGFGRFFS